jgi:hypothetical protein
MTWRSGAEPRVAQAAAADVTAALCLLVLVGCARHVYSPPTRTMPFDDALGPGAGQTNLQVGGASSSALFGPHIGSAAVQVEHGATEKLDIVGSGTWMHLTAQSSDPAPVDNPDRNALAGRAGVRLALFDSRELPGAEERRLILGFALVAGAGGGASRIGTFVAPDAGVALSVRSGAGFDATLSGRTWTSIPVVRRTFGWRDGTTSNPPAVTFGAGLQVQGAVPLVFDPERRGEPPLRLVGGLGLALITDGDDTLGFLQLGGALEVRLH